MAIKFFLGAVSSGQYRSSIFRWNNVRIGQQHRYSATISKADTEAHSILDNMKAKQNFEQFKATKVKSFEEFTRSPEIKDSFGDDLEKIKQAYEDYCLLKFNRYLYSIKGGNPATMI